MPDPMIGQILAGRYEVVRAIGKGGMATVYLAHQQDTGTSVAIKVIQRELASIPQLVLRFQNESQAIARLEHPNTIRVLDSGRTEGGELFIVTELLTGHAVADEIEAGPLPVARSVAIAKQVCLSLAEAHGEGIIHRDVKPDNIFVEDVDGEVKVKLLDFGLAKLEGNLAVTAPNIVVGTILYLSPEQVGKSDLDHRTDLYSLGVTMYEMLAGRVPFGSDKVFDILRDHLFTAPPPIARPDLPPALERLILRLLEKDPAMRPASADEVRAALDSIPIDRSIGEAVPSFDHEAPTNLNAKTALLSRDSGERPFNAFAIAIAIGIAAVLLGAAVMGKLIIETDAPAPAQEEAPAAKTEPRVHSVEPIMIEHEAVIDRREEERADLREPKVEREAPPKSAPRREKKQKPAKKKAPERSPEEAPAPEKPRPLPVTF